VTQHGKEAFNSLWSRLLSCGTGKANEGQDYFLEADFPLPKCPCRGIGASFGGDQSAPTNFILRFLCIGLDNCQILPGLTRLEGVHGHHEGDAWSKFPIQSVPEVIVYGHAGTLGSGDFLITVPLLLIIEWHCGWQSGGLHELSRKYGGQTEVMTAADGLTSDDVRVILEDRNYDVWVGTGSCHP